MNATDEPATTQPSTTVSEQEALTPTTANSAAAAEAGRQSQRFSDLVSGSDDSDDSSDSDDDSAQSQTASSSASQDQNNAAVTRSASSHQGATSRRGRKGEDRHDGDREKQDEQERGGVAGDQILRGMLGAGEQPSIAGEAGQGSEASAALSADQIYEIASQVADRLLVSESGSGEGREVRLSLKGMMLGGTEVRIARESGVLRVSFSAPGYDVGQSLQAHIGELQQALVQRLNATVKVSVDVQGGNQRGSGSSSDGSSGDGRSRNRRDPLVEWQEGEGNRR